jgi:hypothetical protein
VCVCVCVCVCVSGTGLGHNALPLVGCRGLWALALATSPPRGLGRNDAPGAIDALAVSRCALCAMCAVCCIAVSHLAFGTAG